MNINHPEVMAKHQESGTSVVPTNTPLPVTFAEAGVVVIFKDELRAAAAALNVALLTHAAIAGKPATPEQQRAFEQALQDAINYSWTALRHLCGRHVDVVLLNSAEALRNMAAQMGAPNIVPDVTAKDPK